MGMRGAGRRSVPARFVVSGSIIRDVFLHHEVVDDEVLSFHGVLAHVELQQFLHGVGLAQGDLFQTHVLADEVLELVGRNLAETLESRNLRVRAELADGSHALLFRIAVDGLELRLSLPRTLDLVAYAEEGSLQDVDVSS